MTLGVGTLGLAMTHTLPNARTLDPLAAPPLRWGIMGTGWIAERFVSALHASTTQTVVAAGSRSPERSAAFAARLGIPRTFGSYHDLVDSADIDVVYIATEHTAHVTCAEAALNAGKPVLVEKPLAMNAADAARIVNLAAEAGLFCMEAFWTYSLPKFDIIRQILDTGMLGDIQTILADIGEDLTGNRRVMSVEKAGGPMLDLGTYVFGLAHWVLGPQTLVAASGQDHTSGVNGQLSALLTDAANRQTLLHTSVIGDTPTTAVIAGSAATLVIHGPFYQPGAFHVRFKDGETLTYDEPAISHEGLFWQAAEVARCIADGKLESPLRPLADSLATLSTMDEVRRELGIRYPGE